MFGLFFQNIGLVDFSKESDSCKLMIYKKVPSRWCSKSPFDDEFHILSDKEENFRIKGVYLKGNGMI